MKPYKLFSLKNILIDLILLPACLFIAFIIIMGILVGFDFHNVFVALGYGNVLVISSFIGVSLFYLIRRQHTIFQTIIEIFISFLILIGLYYLFCSFVNSVPTASKSYLKGWPIIIVILVTVLSKHLMDDELNSQIDKKKK